MKAVLLAAGYGTRLRPLTDDRPKHLLPVGGRPMLDWILDSVREVEDVDAVHLVTNHRFAADFEEWGASRDVVVHDDGTTSNEDRLGAVGDLRLVIEAAGLGDQELVVLGDDLLELSLPGFVEWWRAKPQPSAAVPLHDVGDLELATHYGTDNAGSFLGWLAHKRAVYGYRFDGYWYDIGNHAQLLEADNRLRRVAGLPERDKYSLD